MREPLAARDCSMASVLTDKYRMGADDASLSTDSNENLVPAKPAGNSRCTARSASPQLNLIVINGQVDARVDEEEEEDREDNEDAQREGAPSDREEAPSISVPSEDAPSDTPGKRPSTKEFWAALSVHAATAAMAGPGTLPSKRAAASAAAKSLLEDGQAMERTNEERSRQRECSTNKFSAKNLQRLKITKEVVRNAASKASVAVLQSGADQGVAAAVASVILLEGGNMARKGSKSSSKDGMKPVPSSGSLGGSNGSEPAEMTADLKADRYATETAEEPQEKDDDASVHTEACFEKVEEEEASLQSYDSAARPRHEDAETQLSFSASRFGRGDKYALTPNTRSTLDAKATPPAAAPGAVVRSSAGQVSDAPGRPLSPVYEEAALASINERVARMGEREQRIEKLSEVAAMAAIEEAVAGLDEAPAPAEAAQKKEEPSTTNPSSKASSAPPPRRRKSKHPIIKATESLSGAMEIIAPPCRGKKRAPKPSGPLEAVQEPDEPQEQDGVEIEYERSEERDDTPVSTVSEVAIKEETGLLKDTSGCDTHGQVQEEEFERKEADLLAAMGVLEQKLDELEEVAGVDGASAAGKSDETTVSEEGPQGVLRQPTKSFPIVDIDEALEEDTTWDEDGNVINSLGEFRIHGTHDMVHDSGVDADLVSLTTKEAEEMSMEVVLVPPHPSSPIARMRQVRNFFAKKTPKVTFDDHAYEEGHGAQVALSPVEDDAPEPETDSIGAHTMFASDPGVTLGRAAVRGATNRRGRPRKSLLKKLGRSFKSGAKKDASADTIFVAHDANVAITPVVEYVAPTAVVPEVQNDPAKEDAARYIVDASRAVEIDRERSFTAAKAWRAAVGSGSEQTIARLKEPSAYHSSKRVESKRRMPSIGESASDDCTLDASSHTDARRTDHSKASDDSWWSRLNETLLGTSGESSSYEEDDDLISHMTYASSANDSLMTDFTSVARFNFV